jgi:hypothetical protein
MGRFWISLLLVVAGAIATVIVNQIVELLKRVNPRVEYSVRDTVPVHVGDKWVGAYLLRIANRSRKRVEDITFHLRASTAALTPQVTEAPPGLESKLVKSEESVSLNFPYLKRGDEVGVKVFAETPYYLPESLTVSISSPHEFTSKMVPYVSDLELALASGNPLKHLSFSIPLLLAVIAVGIALVARRGSLFGVDTRDAIVSAASDAGLPRIAELYVTTPEPRYYEVGDIAYSYAVASGQPAEVDKYRRMLRLTLQADSAIVSESQANLFYCLGRLDLLLQDQNEAVLDFRSGIAKDRALVTTRAKQDQTVEGFLVGHGLL